MLVLFRGEPVEVISEDDEWLLLDSVYWPHSRWVLSTHVQRT